MTRIKTEHDKFLVHIKDEAGDYVISIWDKESLSPIGTLLASHIFTGTMEGSQRQAAGMLARLTEQPVSSVLPRLNWQPETKLKLATN